MAIPVSLADARRQLRLEEDDDSRDVELQGFIQDAAAWIEDQTGQILEARDVTEQVRAGCFTELRSWPIKPGATLTVRYLDQTGTTFTLDGVRLDAAYRPARIRPAFETTWPSAAADRLFMVTFRAGYEPDDVVPGNVRRAMLILITAYDEDREGGAVFQSAEDAAKRLCRGLRRSTL